MAEDAFRIERHGEIAIIVPSNEVERLEWDLIEQAAEMVIAPLAEVESPTIIIDLSEMDFFGSVFLSLLLRTFKAVSRTGGTMVLSDVSEKARELLTITALDTLWAIYDTREEAIEAIE